MVTMVPGQGGWLQSCASPNTLAWKIPWTKEPGELVYGVAKSQTQLSNFTFFIVNMGLALVLARAAMAK